jgi:hypothetical protein
MTTALELINTKEILTNEEREVVLAFDKELDRMYLNNIGEGRWLNVNVYSEHDHHERVWRMERGY